MNDAAIVPFRPRTTVQPQAVNPAGRLEAFLVQHPDFAALWADNLRAIVISGHASVSMRFAAQMPAGEIALVIGALASAGLAFSALRLFEHGTELAMLFEREVKA